VRQGLFQPARLSAFRLIVLLTQSSFGVILPSRAGMRHLGYIPLNVKQMMTTYQTNTGTEAQSEPDSSSVPIACAAYIYVVAQSVGRPSIRPTKRGHDRLYLARNGATAAASNSVCADGFKVESQGRWHSRAGRWSPSLPLAAISH
jgi:hypothetical protein